MEGQYVVIHNGQFGYTQADIGFDASDTRHFIRLLEKKRKESSIKDGNDSLREAKMIRKLLKQAGGYYSVFIYSFVTLELYYFKSKEKANFYIDGSGYLGATKDLRFPPYFFSSYNSMRLVPERRERVNA